jgi:SAM-dependent methyltransferase
MRYCTNLFRIIKRCLPVSLKIKVKRFLFSDKSFYIYQKGFCPVCETKTKFSSTTYEYREDLVCHNCGAPSRKRLLALALDKFRPNWRFLTIHESSPHGKHFFKHCSKYSASQYYPNENLGIDINGFRNENIEKLTFEDNVFDIFITQDVFEHLYNPEKAFSEIARVLKPGGVHIFTVPIHNMLGKTEIWAKAGENGEPIFLKTEEWHGNPVSSEGSPCTMHYGYDIVDMIQKSSGMETVIYRDLSEMSGIFAVPVDSFNTVEVFVSRKM